MSSHDAPRDGSGSGIQARYEVRVGHPTMGKVTNYKTKRGALNAARRIRERGEQATVWEGTARGWGGWSFSAIDRQDIS